MSEQNVPTSSTTYPGAPVTLRELGVPGQLARDLEMAMRLVGATQGSRVVGFTFRTPAGVTHPMVLETSDPSAPRAGAWPEAPSAATPLPWEAAAAGSRSASQDVQGLVRRAAAAVAQALSPSLWQLVKAFKGARTAR